MDSGACPEDIKPDVSAEVAANAPDHAAKAALSATAREYVAACPHCRSTALHRWGTGQKNVRRWRCCKCHRSFSATTGTLLAGLHAPAKFAAAVVDMLSDEPSSCRSLAARLNVSRMTAWAWRRKINTAFAAGLENNDEPDTANAVDAGTLMVRDSRKASREWVDHRRAPAIYPKPDRHRWVDYDRLALPLPSPMSRFLVPVTLCRTRTGDCRVLFSPPSTNAPLIKGIANAGSGLAPLRTRLDVEAASLTDAAPSTSGLFGAAIGVQSTRRRSTSDSACSNDLLDHLRQFLRPFRGPATKYLIGYVAWFIARLTTSDNVHQRLASQRL